MENPIVLCIALWNMKICVSFDSEQYQSDLRQLMQRFNGNVHVYIRCLLGMNNHHFQMGCMTRNIDGRHLSIEWDALEMMDPARVQSKKAMDDV